MIEYLEGHLEEKTPAYVVVDCGGIGYFVNISLNTYTRIKDLERYRMYVHQVIREDMHLLFGFADIEERKIFRHLISVSGVGANTARMILSSLSPGEVQNAILSNNVPVLQAVKGIGAKTAQRIIVDLRDKIGKPDPLMGDSFLTPANHLRDEAVMALIMLGFNKSSSEKAIEKILKSPSENTTVEELIKQALKNL